LGYPAAFFAIIGLVLALEPAKLALITGPTPYIGLGHITVKAAFASIFLGLSLHLSQISTLGTRRDRRFHQVGVAISRFGIALSIVALIVTATRAFS
jgi:hypothetical protein